MVAGLNDQLRAIQKKQYEENEENALYSMKLGDEIYRVKTTVKKIKQEGKNKFYSLEIQEMEIIEARSEKQRMGDANSTQNPTTTIDSISATKLLNNVRKSNNDNINGKNISVGVNVSLKRGAIEVSSVISAYGRSISSLLNKELEYLLYPDVKELKRRISQVSTGPKSPLNATSSAYSYKDKQSLSKRPNNAEEKSLYSLKSSAPMFYSNAANAVQGIKQEKATPDQWVAVRTKAFKNWFGDWELARKLIRVLDLGDKIVFKNFSEARQWAKANILGLYKNPEVGDVNISGEAIGKYLSQKAVEQSASRKLHLLVLPIMPDMLRNSVVGDTHEDREGNSNISDIVRLFACVRYGDGIYRVKTTVKRYNDPSVKSKAYSYEVTEIELLDGTLEAHTLGADSSTTSNNSITGAKLLKGVKKSKSSDDILSHSKILDENGEPKVVYHQTNDTVYINRETGENWDELDWREKEEWKKDVLLPNG